MSIVIPEDATESGEGCTEPTYSQMSDRELLTYAARGIDTLIGMTTASGEMLREIHTVMMYLGKTVKQINDSPGGIMKLLMGGLGRK